MTRDAPVSESWQQRTGCLIVFVTIMLSLLAMQVANFVHDSAVAEACRKSGGVLADDGHGHRNCVRPVTPIEEDHD